MLRRPAVALVLALACVGARAETLEARVVHVGDGDSLSLCVGEREVRVRLVGIDAPEYRQAHGKASRQSLAELCADRPARATWQHEDRFGRALARVFCDGVDANLEQVRRGMAWAYGRETEPGLREAQGAARAARLGLWADADPLPPWKWRRAHPRAPDAPAAANAPSRCAAAASG